MTKLEWYKRLIRRYKLGLLTFEQFEMAALYVQWQYEVLEPRIKLD